jgi:hypothetical protein
VTRNLSKIKFLMITILFWPVLALSSASTSATLSSSQTSSSSVQTAGCLTQITAFGTPNTGGDYASQCGAGQWCTSESTNAFSTLASTAMRLTLLGVKFIQLKVVAEVVVRGVQL